MSAGDTYAALEECLVIGVRGLRQDDWRKCIATHARVNSTSSTRSRSGLTRTRSRSESRISVEPGEAHRDSQTLRASAT